jgi:hypothetical protein
MPEVCGKARIPWSPGPSLGDAPVEVRGRDLEA